MQLIKRRMQEFNIWSEERFHTFSMRTQFNAGPFSVEPFRVTHSIPDCCGLVLRGEAGTIVHTGDWKIDETPVDGEMFDRPFFEQLGVLIGVWCTHDAVNRQLFAVNVRWHAHCAHFWV